MCDKINCLRTYFHNFLALLQLVLLTNTIITLVLLTQEKLVMVVQTLYHTTKVHCNCSAPFRANFLSNPRWIHSGQKDKEKEEYKLLWAVICHKQPLLSLFSPPPSPFPPTLRVCCTRLRLCYQD
jgi:hypothetical protein